MFSSQKIPPLGIAFFDAAATSQIDALKSIRDGIENLNCQLTEALKEKQLLQRTVYRLSEELEILKRLQRNNQEPFETIGNENLEPCTIEIKEEEEFGDIQLLSEESLPEEVTPDMIYGDRPEAVVASYQDTHQIGSFPKSFSVNNTLIISDNSLENKALPSDSRRLNSSQSSEGARYPTSKRHIERDKYAVQHQNRRQNSHLPSANNVSTRIVTSTFSMTGPQEYLSSLEISQQMRNDDLHSTGRDGCQQNGQCISKINSTSTLKGNENQTAPTSSRNSSNEVGNVPSSCAFKEPTQKVEGGLHYHGNSASHLSDNSDFITTAHVREGPACPLVYQGTRDNVCDSDKVSSIIPEGDIVGRNSIEHSKHTLTTVPVNVPQDQTRTTSEPPSLSMAVWSNIDLNYAEKLKHIPRKEDFELMEPGRTSTEGETLHCRTCNIIFTDLRDFTTHVKVSHRDRPFQCELCGKRFAQKGNLGTHMRTHSGEKPYRCKFCKRDFSHKVNLNTHMRKHSGERPYQCTICTKAFYDQGNFLKHKRIHMKEAKKTEAFP